MDVVSLEWQQAATCRRFPPGPWDYDAVPQDRADAVEICQRCPVRDACYDYGVAERFCGVWGGVNLIRGRDAGEAREVTRSYYRHTSAA